MISYIRLVIFVPSLLTTGAVDFKMWMVDGLRDGAIFFELLFYFFSEVSKVK
jgi:hypothetical protein